MQQHDKEFQVKQPPKCIENMKDVPMQDTPTVQSQRDASIALAHDIKLTEEQGVCQKLN